LIAGFGSSVSATGIPSFSPGAYTCIFGFGAISTTSESFAPGAIVGALADGTTVRCGVSIVGFDDVVLCAAKRRTATTEDVAIACTH
jgi:hypothetical protein